jgi:uncharacterized protein RhaS with RHS repeats
MFLLSVLGNAYYRARYYDPSIGRFLSEDPIRFWGGVDFYKYVDNSPTNAKDPSGTEKIYGYWCGGDWTGGHVEQYNPHHDNSLYYFLPIDKLDDACRTHDIRYYECRQAYKCDRKGRIQCFKNADRWLANAARNSGANNIEQSGIVLWMENSNPSFMAGDDDPSCACKK